MKIWTYPFPSPPAQQFGMNQFSWIVQPPIAVSPDRIRVYNSPGHIVAHLMDQVTPFDIMHPLGFAVGRMSDLELNALKERVEDEILQRVKRRIA